MDGVSHYLRFFAAALFCAGLLYGDLRLALFDEVRGGMSWVLVPFRTAATLPGDAYQNARDYLRGREALLQEKQSLRQRILLDSVKLKSLDFYLQQNEELRGVLGLRERLSGSWLVAEVARDTSQASARRVILDKGVSDGVVPGLAVVDESGVVGQVIRADFNTCVVGLLTDPGQWISARVRRSNLLVVLRGDGGGGLVVEYVSNDADIRAGDVLVADGGLFPPGYPVAVVEQLDDGVVYKKGLARPLSDFSDGAFALLYFTESPAPVAGAR